MHVIQPRTFDVFRGPVQLPQQDNSLSVENTLTLVSFMLLGLKAQNLRHNVISAASLDGG